MIVLGLLHAFVDEVHLLASSFHVHFVASSRFEHFQISFKLWKLLAVDGKEKIENEKRRPNTEVSHCHGVTSDVRISFQKKSLDAPVSSDHTTDFVWRN